jgi:hypothetical protein
VLYLVIGIAVPIHAESCINTEDHPTSLASMTDLVPDLPLNREEIKSLQKEEKILQRFERRMERFQYFTHSQKGQKRLGGFSDSVDRWFWFWVIGWGAGILLSILAGGVFTSGVIGILWFTLFVAGSVSLVMWLVKKFS